MLQAVSTHLVPATTACLSVAALRWVATLKPKQVAFFTEIRSRGGHVHRPQHETIVVVEGLALPAIHRRRSRRNYNAVIGSPQPANEGETDSGSRARNQYGSLCIDSSRHESTVHGGRSSRKQIPEPDLRRIANGRAEKRSKGLVAPAGAPLLLLLFCTRTIFDLIEPL